MPFEILQVTAAYSNAVLVAIMPHVSEFAKNVDLPLPHPITVSQVARFGCSPRTDHVGGRVVLTNDYSFTFDRGAVVLYRSPNSYYSLQEPQRISEFYGLIKIKKEEAVKIAHNALKKLGYTDSALHLDHPPKVTLPPNNQGKRVARYLVEWFNLEQVTPPGGISGERVTVEVDATNGRIQMLGIQSKTTKRPDPQVGVQLPVVVPQPKSQPVGGTKLERVSDAYSQTFLAAILPELSAFVRTIGVDVKIPITTDDVDLKHYEFGFVGNDPKAFLYLKTGDRFVYQHGHVTDFEAHDSYRRPEPNKLPEDKPVEQFFGTINMTETESLSLARKAINDLGYAAKIPQLKKKPEVVAPRKYGTNYFARYFFNWWPNDEGIQIAVIEVDATAKKLKAFYINDRISTNIWREPPKIDVPISPPDSLK